MSDHSTVLVPIESWCYNSPDVRSQGRSLDIGLLAEALIYYDRVYVNLSNQPQFAELLLWFIRQNKFADFLALVKEGTIGIYEYSFATSAVQDKDAYIIVNIQDEIQKNPNTFERRFLYHPDIENCLKNSRQRKSLYTAFRGKVIEAKASEFSTAIENAKQDFDNPDRNALILQAFVDDLYHIRGLGKPPEVQASVRISPDGLRKSITWNIRFDEITRIAGTSLNFHSGTPLSAGAICNRFIWSAAKLGCDLYTGQPMSILVGDKLYESSKSLYKTHDIIENLQEKVEFPDVRRLVNEGNLNFEDIILFRKKGQRFRTWLQSEAVRDRDAIIAYHNEVGKELGLLNVGRKSLKMFGILAGGAAGPVIESTVTGSSGTALGGAIGGAVGNAVGDAVGFLFDVVSKMGSSWKPVVFGNWMSERISKLVERKDVSV